MNLNNLKSEDVAFLVEKTKDYLKEKGIENVHLNNEAETKNNIEAVLFAINELNKKDELILYNKQKENIRVTKINPNNNPYHISAIITNHSYKIIQYPMIVDKLKEMGICGRILLDNTSHQGLYSNNRFLIFGVSSQYIVDFKQMSGISIDKEFIEFLEYLLYREVNLNATVLSSSDIDKILDKVKNMQENKYIKEYESEGN